MSQSRIVQCVIAHSTNNRSWAGTHRLQALPEEEGSTFKCWILSSNSKEDVYFFGVTRSDGSVRYVTNTTNRIGAHLSLQPCSTPPTNINIENGEEKSDRRAFVLRSSGRLGLASSDGLYASYDDETGEVITGNPGDEWIVKYLK